MASICFDKQSVKISCNVQLWTDIIPQKVVTRLQTVNKKWTCAYNNKTLQLRLLWNFEENDFHLTYLIFMEITIFIPRNILPTENDLWLTYMNDVFRCQRLLPFFVLAGIWQMKPVVYLLLGRAYGYIFATDNWKLAVDAEIGGLPITVNHELYVGLLWQTCEHFMETYLRRCLYEFIARHWLHDNVNLFNGRIGILLTPKINLLAYIKK